MRGHGKRKSFFSQRPFWIDLNYGTLTSTKFGYIPQRIGEQEIKLGKC